MIPIRKIFIVVLLPIVCFAHGDKFMHYKDFIDVFNGYGDPQFQKLSYSVSSGIDSDLPALFREKIGSIPGNHRILGHGWTLNDSIPRETLNYLCQTYPGKEKEIIEVWRTFANGIVDEAATITGLPPKQAQAFASLLYDIHLLGDLTPDNVMIKYVLSPNSIVNNIVKDVRILFPNNPRYVSFIERRLFSCLAQMKGKDPQLIAQAVLDECKRLRLGSMMKDAWGNTLQLEHSVERAIAANGRMVQRTLQKIPGASQKDIRPTHKDIRESDFHQESSNGETLNAGLLTYDGRLLLAVKEGAKTALLIIAIDGGKATYHFIRGNILKPEFEEKMIDAAIKGGVVGTAVGVAVFMGAIPGGFVVTGVGIGAYFIVDKALAVWHEHEAKKYLTVADLEAYGIELDTILELPKDSIFDPSADTTLELETDSTLIL